MRTFSTIALLILSIASIGFAQGNREPSAKAATNRVAAPVVRIIAPAPGENMSADSLSVLYDVDSQKNLPTRPAKYRLQLDSQLPVETAETTYTFDSLTPGQHNLVIELVDSKQRPIKASRAEIAFVSSAPETTPADLVVEPMMPPTLQKVAMFLPQAAAPIDSGDGSAEMPLLSVIGLGVLVGGMVSAMKTRI